MQKPFEISTSVIDSQSTELRGTSYLLRRRTSAAYEKTVKSVKHHFKRCIGLHTLTFEEMSTLLCRIEACLNSRPIAPVSYNLDDYHALTSGHFLIGTSLIAPAEPSILNLNENRLSL